jgi:hypothetical protein
MADAVLDCPDVLCKFLGKGEGRTHETSDPLPQGVVTALDVLGWRRFRGNRFGWGCWNDACGGFVVIRVKGGLRTIRRRDVGPQLCCTWTAPIAHMEGNDRARGGGHRQPKPLLVGFLLDTAAHLVRLNVQSLDDHRMGRGEGLYRQMIGQSRKTGAHKVYKPPAAHPHHTANAVEGDLLAYQAFHQGTVLGRHEALRRASHKLATTGLALIVLFAGMDMPIFLELLGSTCWICLSHAHHCVRASLVSVSDPGQQYQGIESRALLV